MERKKLFVKVSVVPGKEYFLQFTPLSEVLSAIDKAPNNIDILVKKENEPLIPIDGDNKKEKTQKLKTFLLELLKQNRIASITPEESLLEILQR